MASYFGANFIMSISFRRPKKPVRPRLVMIGNEGDDEDMDDEPSIVTSTPTAPPPVHQQPSGNNSSGPENGSSSSIPGKSSSKGKTKPASSSSESKKANTLLSFDDELEGEEGEVFKVKKSSVSRRLMKQRGREKKESKVAPKEEKDSAASLQKTKFQIETFTADIKLKDSKEKRSSPVLRILNGREAEAVHMESSDDEDEDDDGGNVRFRRPAHSEIQEELRRVLQQGQIPDAKLIHEARKRKQMARQMGGTEFIPVDNVNRLVSEIELLVHSH